MRNLRSLSIALAFSLCSLVLLFFFDGCRRPASQDEGSAAPTGQAIKNTFAIQKTDQTGRVDGRLDESFWKTADRLTDFRVDSDPKRIPSARTEVLLAYNDKSLLAAFILQEPGNEMPAPGSDICEISVFARPETPFYSPFLQRLDYMNANEDVRTMRRFLVTSANERRQANVYKERAHTPYIIDEKWVSAWETAVSHKKGAHVIEISIPWADIRGLPRAGDTFRINLVRTRKTAEGIRESSWFSWYSGPNITVRPWASENFIQEYPTIFAPVQFDDGRAVLIRYVETEDPWRVSRPQTEFESVLSERPDPWRSAHFYLGLSSFLLSDSIRKLYDQKTWDAEEANLLVELGMVGANGPFLPGFLEKAGLRRIEELYKKYGMRFNFHGYANARQAAKEGASILTPGGTAAFFDSVYIRLKNKMLVDFLGKYGKAPWLADVWGQDEPFNQIATILQPGTYERVNREIKETYGVELGVPPGLPNVPYERQPVQPNSRFVPDHQTALSRIAVFRWMNKTYAGVARGEQEIVRRLAPGKPCQAYNRNSVADLDFLDQALLWDYTESYSADPYPSFCIYVYGPARSRYHVGFTSKLVTDLAAGKPTQMIIQGCEMIQRLSTVENVREWASQAAKAGVSKLDWWGTPRLDYPDVYREMVRLSKLWQGLPALDLPRISEIAILFSDDARAAAGDEGLERHYSLHALLGEHLGAWFSFVSENHVRKGLHTLAGKKLILAPELGYISRPFAQEILRRVEEGAVLVVLDPDAFNYDIETGSLEELRKEILGIGMCPRREASSLMPTALGRTRFQIEHELPLRALPIVEDKENARVLEPPPASEILFSYPDGTAAVYSRKIGKGEVIYFGAMPFWDSELAIQPAGWDRWLGALLGELGIARNLPLWKFMFPATGGEVKFLDLLVSIPRD
jgi:hypothetical protein